LGTENRELRTNCIDDTIAHKPVPQSPAIRRGVFHGAPEAKPRRERDTASRIQRHAGRSSRPCRNRCFAEEQIGGPQGLFDRIFSSVGRSHSSRLCALRRCERNKKKRIADSPHSAPKEAFQVHSSGRGGMRIECVARVNQSANFLARVAAASAESSRLVRQKNQGPQTSVRHPRGRPPVRVSPVRFRWKLVFWGGPCSMREAGITPASLGRTESCFMRSQTFVL